LRSFWTSLRKSFVTGLLLVAPVVVTIVILYLAVKVLTDPTRKVLKSLFNALQIQPFPGTEVVISIGITFLLLVLLGYLGRSYVGRKGLGIVDLVISRIPFAKTIYAATKKLLASFSMQKDLERVVLVEYPRKGVWTMGFLTSEHEGFLDDETGKKYFNVFLPTTPNPTSGYLLVFPASDVIPLDITIEDGVTFIMSGGVAAPALSRKPAKQP